MLALLQDSYGTGPTAYVIPDVPQIAMPRGALGRLPTLSSIGKSQNVDEEEPPEGSDAEDLYYPQRDDSDDYFYEPTHADETARALARTFKIFNPSNHVCKRTKVGGTSFSHCKQAVTFGRKYAELRSLMEARAKLRLIRDYISRINAAAMYVRDLETVAQEEFQTWYDICHDSLTGTPQTKLECLSSICEDLRIHMNHWNSIKQLTHTDRWLRPLLPSLCFEMDAVRQKLFHLRDHAIWWIDRLIRIGLQVLAHCDLERLSQDALWSITRGLEDFNNIVVAVRFENLQQNISVTSFFPNNCSANVIRVASLSCGAMQDGNSGRPLAKSAKSSSSPTSSVTSSSSAMSPPPNTLLLPGTHQYPWGLSCSQAAVVMNSYRNLGESIKPIPFIRVLNILSSERSKYAAIMAHRIFTTNDEFVNLTQCRLGPYTWNEASPGSASSYNQNRLQPNGSTSAATSSSVNTSDYHSGSASGTTQSGGVNNGGSVTSATMNQQGARFIVGNMRVPDLAKEMSNLAEFSQREFDFASKFLHIVCSSTNLLKKASSAQQHLQQRSATGGSHSRESPASASAPKHHKEKDNKDKAPPAPIAGGGNPTISVAFDVGGDSAGGPPQTTVGRSVTTSDPKRKSVSWGDTVENSVKQQLTAKYMDLLWQFCGSHLYEFFNEPIWGGVDSVQGQLGHVAVCPDTVIILVVRMMQQVCLTAKEGTPLGALSAMASIGRRLEACNAWAAWDAGLCGSLASQTTDRCQPTPLADAEYSTVTARQLRDTYQPLVHVLRLLDVSAATTDDRASVNGAIPAIPRGPSLALLIPSLQRLLVTSDLAARWCYIKANEFLSSWALGHFLLVTQSDMKILSDEVKRSVVLAQRLCNAGCHGNSQIEVQMQLQLSQLLFQLNSVNGHMQTVASSVVKGFSQKCLDQAREFFEEAMPLTKIWRKKGVRDLPTEHQAYVGQAMETLLEPVVVGVSKLRVTAQLSAVSMATGAVCEAWTQHILHQKIRFSVYGAHQLQLDFGYVRLWLQTAIQHPEVRQSVLSLDVFKYLDGIISLLKRQPKGRSSSRPPPTRTHCSTEDTSYVGVTCECSVLGHRPTAPLIQSLDAGSASMVSGTTHGDSNHDVTDRSVNGQSTEGSQEGETTYYRVPNMEQWLALRVHGGARTWPKLPSCFNSGEP